MHRTAGALKLQSQAKSWPYMVIFVGLGVGATGPVLIRLAQSEGIPSLAVVAIRQILATLCLTPVVWRSYRHELRQLAPRDLLFAGLAGIVVAVRFFLLFEAYDNISILISGVFSGSGPLWVALVEILFLKATFDRRIWLGLAMAVAGGAIIGVAGFDGGTSLGNNPTLGALYALGSAALSAIYFNVGRSVRARVSLWPYLWLIFLFAGIAALIASAATGTALTGYSATGYLWLFLLTITAQFFGHGAINFALAYVSATFVSISTQLGTVVSAVLAFLVFGELPGPLQVLGSVIITLGVILATISSRSRRPAATRPED